MVVITKFKRSDVCIDRVAQRAHTVSVVNVSTPEPLIDLVLVHASYETVHTAILQLPGSTNCTLDVP